MLRTKCRCAIETLLENLPARVRAIFLDGTYDLSATITPAEFEEVKRKLVSSWCLRPVERALADSNVAKRQICEVILVGETTRELEVQRKVRDFFDEGEVDVPMDFDTPGFSYRYADHERGVCAASLRQLGTAGSLLTVGRELDGGIITKILKL